MLQRIFVRGEVSNCKYHSSGHIYFTLKDGKGTIGCVMFAGSRGGLSFRMSDGQQVIVGGTVDVFERDGKYQLYAREITLEGSGRLYEMYEKLKRELEGQGLFAREYKRSVPKYIRTLGVVTAETGAAVRDIIQISKRRNPFVQIILYPAIVQGDGAVASIVRGIREMEDLGVDVMIVGRGGGSIEDLWAFNEREVAQAVFDCKVPVISAVGHETDTTIVDFVADLRAPTPSAAAELAVADLREIRGAIACYGDALDQGIGRKLDSRRERAGNLALKLQVVSPEYRIRGKRMEILSAEKELEERMGRLLETRRHELALYAEKMKGLSPLDRLYKGYSYVQDEKGRNIRSVRQTKQGKTISIMVTDGRIDAVVKDIEAFEIKDDLR